MTTRLYAAAGLLLLAVSSIRAATAGETRHLTCPSEINASSIRLIDIPEGWTGDTPAPLRLNSAAPMAGPPSMKAYLAPDSYKKNKKMWVDRFLLGQPDTDGNWISCNYGDGNAVMLAKRIDDNIRECTVTYSKRGTARPLIDIACK